MPWRPVASGRASAMRFAVAAYAISVLTLLLYGLNMARERRALRRETARNAE